MTKEMRYATFGVYTNTGTWIHLLSKDTGRSICGRADPEGLRDIPDVSADDVARAEVSMPTPRGIAVDHPRAPICGHCCNMHRRHPTYAARAPRPQRTCAVCREAIIDGQCECSRTEPREGEGPQGEDWLEARACALERRGEIGSVSKEWSEARARELTHFCD